ncbi:hypothetical protein [uncultured Thiohalocapsa sp.]|uniref:hypothetical protein n=1 Tax=uncultured Thiohalocapsa sp. TaxID=768990 RepID=UPI0025FEA21A|nr:hypothetical protein [uncultured Thiohalocapsa sp.]
MSDLAGQLDIRIQPDPGSDAAPPVRIASSRPLTAARVFARKPLAAVAGQLPLLFSICGTAQALAGARACEAALGLAPAPSAQWARTLLLRAETAKEHLWRLLLDWPQALAGLESVPQWEPPAAQPAPGEAAIAAAMRAFLQLRALLGTAGDPFLPGADGVEPAPGPVASACATLTGTAAEQVFGAAPAEWLAATGSAADLHEWAVAAPTPAAALVRAVTEAGLADLGRSAIGTLPAVGDAGGLLAQLAPPLAAADADAFIAAPELAGLPVETTPFARELARRGLVAELAAAHGNGLLPRLAALLVELARDAALLAAPWSEDARAPAGVGCVAPQGQGAGTDVRVGLGAAPAARGLLVHRVGLAPAAVPGAARVLDYRILAPTEWNFHPAGVVAAGLGGIAAADIAPPMQGSGSTLRGGAAPARAELEARARLFVTAVDPCVDYELSVC